MGKGSPTRLPALPVESLGDEARGPLADDEVRAHEDRGALFAGEEDASRPPPIFTVDARLPAELTEEEVRAVRRHIEVVDLEIAEILRGESGRVVKDPARRGNPHEAAALESQEQVAGHPSSHTPLRGDAATTTRAVHRRGALAAPDPGQESDMRAGDQKGRMLLSTPSVPAITRA